MKFFNSPNIEFSDDFIELCGGDLFFKGTYSDDDIIRDKYNGVFKNLEYEEKEIGGYPVIDVKLDENAVVWAREFGRITNWLALQKCYGHRIAAKGKPAWFYPAIGHEGAFACGAYLFDNYLKVVENIRFGKPDEGDLTFTNGQTADVKTRDRMTNSGIKPNVMMIPVSQFRAHKYDFYIGCHEVDENLVRIWWYATRADAEAFLHKNGPENFSYGPTLAIPFVELKDIRILKQQLKMK